MDPDTPSAEAIAVVDGRIAAVGSLSEIRAATDTETSMINDTFKDKVIVAGLIDQHLHPMLAALTLNSAIVSIEDWQLPEQLWPAARSHEDYLSKLSKIESLMSDPKELLLSWGYHHYFHGGLSRTELDAISDTRPIIVWHRSAHEFILNSAALALGNVQKADIMAQQQVVQDQINLPAGHFWERGAFEFLLPKIMPLIASPQRLQKGLLLTEAFMHANGVTTSAEPGGFSEFYDAVSRVVGDEGTPFHFYFIPDGRALMLAHAEEDIIAQTKALTKRSVGKARFLPKQVKLFSDGAMFSQLMRMQDGYTDGHHGEWLMEPDAFAAAFRVYWDAGYQIHVHQNGDAGLQMVLDNLSENMERNPRKDHRTTLVHFGFSTREQVQRLAELGAIVSANPYYTVALADRYSEIGIGPERADAMVRLGDLVHENISFSFHSDMPMAPSSPLFLVWTAVNRVTSSGRVAGPAQRISVLDALKAVTIDAAFSLRLENEIGSITPGKRANFTVLEANPFDVDPMTIKDIQVNASVIDGEIHKLH